jgi:hypothetical protein
MVDENRQQLVSAGAIPVLVSLLNSSDTDVQYYCTTALSNIAVDSESNFTVLSFADDSQQSSETIGDRAQASPQSSQLDGQLELKSPMPSRIGST